MSGFGAASRGGYQPLPNAEAEAKQDHREVSAPVSGPGDGKAASSGDQNSSWKFVEAGWFQVMAAFSIIINLVMVLYELDDPSLGPSLFWPNQVLLCFFIFELVSRMQYFGSSFWVGPMTQVVWNALDIGVIALALTDIGLELFASSSDSTLVIWFKLARVVRVFRLFRVLMEADLSWTKETRFQNFIGIVIGINALLMSLETDIDWQGWFYIEHVLLMIYSFELFSSLKRDGLTFFDNKNPDFTWNVVDFAIVFCSALDSWLMPFITLVLKVFAGGAGATEGKSSLGQALMLMRMARLMRILRLIKLVKAVRPLLFLVVGVIAALQGVVWVLILTVVSLYAAGIVTTRLIGHKMIFPDPGAIDDDILSPFVTVPESMFTLFRVMSGSLSQKEEYAIDELMKALPSVKFAFVFFMITSSWTLLSILTAVVSENMISTTQQQYEDLKLSLFEEDRIMQAEELGKLFSEFDASGDGCVDAEEVEAAMQNEDFAQQTAVLLKMPKRDILEVLHMMIKQEQNPGGVAMQRFVECLIDSSTPVTERSIMKIESRMADLFHNMDRLEEVIRTGSSTKEVVASERVGMRMSRSSRDALPKRNSGGNEDGDLPKRNSRGSEDGDLPRRNSRGSEGGDLPKRNSRGSEGGDLPKRNSKGSRDGDLPKRNSRGSQDGDLPKQNSRGSLDGDLSKTAPVGQGCLAEAETDISSTVTSDATPFSKSVDQLVRRFGELERRHREDLETLCSTLDSRMSSWKEGQDTLPAASDFLVAAQRLQDTLVERFNELERRHQDYFRTLFGKFEDFNAKEPGKPHSPHQHAVLGCPMPHGAPNGLNQARDIVDLFADVPLHDDDGEVSIQQAGGRAMRARQKMKDIFCCSRV